jgi:lipoprotein-releasing system permease protein
MRAEFFISVRYLLTKRKEKFLSFISLISVLGIAIGVTALIVVLAVMTGFDRDLHQKIVGNYSDITLTGMKPLDQERFASVAETLKSWPHVKAFSPYLAGQVLVKEGSRFIAVTLKGVRPESEVRVSRAGEYLLNARMEDLKPGEVFAGKELAASFGFTVGSTITVFSPQGKEHTLKVAGLFASGMYEYDMNLLYAEVSTAQAIYGMSGQYNAVAIKLDDLYRADKVRQGLQEKLGYEYLLRTWMEANQNFFAALQLEKFTMFIILTLIILVAAFNIVSTLVVLVVEKTKDIGILRALGMSAKGIRTLFMCEGVIIGGVGVLAGVAGGLTLCGLLEKYQFIKLPQDVYYIDRLPVAVVWWPDMALTVGAALAIALLATIYPAVKASRLKPVEALRYE